MILHRLQSEISKQNTNSKIFTAGMMVFFFVIFDGILMYLSPITISNSGISESLMGLILGSSSIAGMLFDIILCRTLKSTHYKSMFLFMFILAMSFPIFLFGGNTITIYFLAMAVWGFYYNFYNIGTLDFVERTNNPEQHTSNFGILRSFEGLGYFIAPFLGSILLLIVHPGPKMILVLAIPLIISFIFYLRIRHSSTERKEYSGVARKDALSFFKEIGLWKNIWSTIFPILLLTLIINLLDAAIWTFGPLFSENFGSLNNIPGGVFMTAYALPPILVGWSVGFIARKFGNIHTAHGSIALGSIILIIVGFITSPFLLIFSIFIASFFFAIGWPAINAMYAEYIEKTPHLRKETETLQDLFTNFGDTGGPIVGGYMAQYLGFAHSFIALGFVGIIVATYLSLQRQIFR